MKSNKIIATLLLVYVTACTAYKENQSRNMNDPTLYFVVVLPYPDSAPVQPSLTDGPDIYPAAELAVEHVNNQSGLLEDHTVKLIQSNGGCDVSTTTVLGFVKDIVLSPHRRVAGIIGPGCSGSTLTVAPLLAQDRLSLINIHISGSPLLTDRIRYPYALGMLSSTSVYVDAMVELMKRNKWQHIFALYEESRPAFVSTFSAFEDRLKNESELRIRSSPLQSSTLLPLDDILESRSRVIFVMAGPVLSNRLMCYAFHQENMLYYPSYQWVFVNRMLSDFSEVSFSFDQKQFTCSREEIVGVALNKSILLHYRLTHLGNASTSGRTHSQYFEEYEERVNRHNVTTSVFGAPIYDAVWSLALALNKSIHPLQERGFSLSDYHLDHSQHNNMTEIILHQLYELNFTGVSGDIAFDIETGFVDSRGIDFFENIGGEVITVAYYSNKDGLINISEVAEFIPNDFDMRHVLVHPAAAVLLILAGSVSLVVIVVAHVLTVAFRAHSSIRASSFRLTNIIYVGCYMLIGGLAVYQILTVFAPSKTLFNISCNGFLWCVSIAYTLIFGTICVRNWRVYRIFNHFSNPGKYLSDNSLTVFVLSLLLLDVAICGAWSGTDPLLQEVTETFSVEDTPFIQSTAICTSNNFFPWFASIIVYKVALSSCAVYLSLITGRIHHKLQDFSTKRVAILIYISTFFNAIGLSSYVVASFVLMNVTVNYIIFSIFLIIQLYLFLGFLFCPTLRPVIQEKLSNYSCQICRKFNHCKV